MTFGKEIKDRGKKIITHTQHWCVPQQTLMFTFNKMEVQEGFHVLAHKFTDKETMQIEISMGINTLRYSSFKIL